jgi:hypothetical protein
MVTGCDATNLRPDMYYCWLDSDVRREGIVLMGASEAQANIRFAVAATASVAGDTVSRPRTINDGRQP